MGYNRLHHATLVARAHSDAAACYGSWWRCPGHLSRRILNFCLSFNVLKKGQQLREDVGLVINIVQGTAQS